MTQRTATLTDRVNTFLRSEAALLTLLAMALISQTPHTAVLFHRLSPTATGAVNVATWLHAVAYAVALEFATLVFVVRGQRYLAWGFAIVSGIVNLLYYATGEWTPLYVASAVLVSIALPASIAFYSHSVAAQAHEPEAQDVTADETEKTPLETTAHIVLVPTHQNDTIDVPSPSYAAQMDARAHALLLAQQEGKSAAEIARIIGKKDSTVRSWLRRAQVNGSVA